MTIKLHLSLLALVSVILSIPSVQAAPERATITVSAAASLKGALTELGMVYEKQQPVRVNFNFGSSGALQRQIEEGAPVDVFIAAAARNMNELAEQKRIEISSRRIIASNKLVLIVPSDSTLSIHRFKDLVSAQVKRVAIGGAQVPAGLRAREVFTRLGIWPQIEAKAVRGKDVREALAHVEQGNVQAGIVYLSDAASSNQVRVVATAPDNMHAPIVYPAAVIAGRPNVMTARSFVKFLASPPARAVLRRYRFTAP